MEEKEAERARKAYRRLSMGDVPLNTQRVVPPSPSRRSSVELFDESMLRGSPAGMHKAIESFLVSIEDLPPEERSQQRVNRASLFLDQFVGDDDSGDESGGASVSSGSDDSIDLLAETRNERRPMSSALKKTQSFFDPNLRTLTTARSVNSQTSLLDTKTVPPDLQAAVAEVSLHASCPYVPITEAWVCLLFSV